jgi:transcriptional regulator with XRE-family HTH domain
VTGAFGKLNQLFFMIEETASIRVQHLLGANLRRLRIARHLSLSELARATGVSKATLWGVENRRSNPTLDTLAALAGALGVALGELLEQAPLGEIRVLRAAQGPTPDSDGATWRRLDGYATPGRMELAELTLGPRQLHEAQPLAAGCRAQVYVVKGTLIVGPVERISELGEGDYAAFPADTPHVYESARHPARALVLTRWAS